MRAGKRLLTRRFRNTVTPQQVTYSFGLEESSGYPSMPLGLTYHLESGLTEPIIGCRG